MIEIHDTRVIDAAAEKRRRKISDSAKTDAKASSGESLEPKSSNLFHNFKTRILSRRKHKRKEGDEKSLKTTGSSRPEEIPQKVVIFEGGCEGVMSLNRYLTDQLEKQLEKSGGSQTVNQIWTSAIEEFKKTLTSLSMIGHKDLLMGDLVRNFEESFDKQIENFIGNEEQKKLNFPKPLYMNSFRQMLEDYILNFRTRPRGKPKPRRDLENMGGHNFQKHTVLQPNTCPVCSKSLWVTDKAHLCSICKILVHKDCISDYRLPACTKGDTLKLFNTYLERVCREGSLRPEFVVKVLQYLELNGKNKQGIYRVSGAKVEENKLKQELDLDPFCTKLRFDEYNVHCVASIFKSFLRQLPTPLLPFEVSSKTIMFLNRSSI